MEVRGQNRGSYIAGRSVHSTRIERLWRDVSTAVSSNFIAVFEEMEQQGILAPQNESDLFCLHYVFLPRINSSLKSFQLAWNHHPLSTEQNHSPMQLYTQGAIGNELFEDLQFYGIDHEEPLQEDETDEVTVPATISQRSLEYLLNTVNPLQECSDNGIQLYVSTVSALMQRDNLI